MTVTAKPYPSTIIIEAECMECDEEIVANVAQHRKQGSDYVPIFAWHHRKTGQERCDGKPL